MNQLSPNELYKSSFKKSCDGTVTTLHRLLPWISTSLVLSMKRFTMNSSYDNYPSSNAFVLHWNVCPSRESFTYSTFYEQDTSGCSDINFDQFHRSDRKKKLLNRTFVTYRFESWKLRILNSVWLNKENDDAERKINERNVFKNHWSLSSDINFYWVRLFRRSLEIRLNDKTISRSPRFSSTNTRMDRHILTKECGIIEKKNNVDNRYKR